MAESHSIQNYVILPEKWVEIIYFNSSKIRIRLLPNPNEAWAWMTAVEMFNHTRSYSMQEEELCNFLVTQISLCLDHNVTETERCRERKSLWEF